MLYGFCSKIVKLCSISVPNTVLLRNLATTSAFQAPTKWPSIPNSVIYHYRPIPDKTPAHHNNPETEKFLSKELCNFPPYQQRKVFAGYSDAIMKRDLKRRMVAFHFAPLRTRLNSLRKNSILPKEIQDLASSQMQRLPRDANWTRIKMRCTLTSRRRGCKRRWRMSRIMFRHFADYNKLSGVNWAFWTSRMFSERKHLFWPPPDGLTVPEYIVRYHRNLADNKHRKLNKGW